MLQNIALTFATNNEQLLVNFLTCAAPPPSPEKKKFLPISISCRCLCWGAVRVAGSYPDGHLSLTGSSYIDAFYYTAMNPKKKIIT